ncbi:MAG: hypothetical protein NWE93_09035 [Candidatus Bathyarchaeota archaeon]|nr:hypothetical protein [Candidatus Bathyarchaeota archaeon]
MSTGEKKNFVCQNPSCQQTFTAPLKTLNLQADPTEPYYACPFCLTKIEEPTIELPQAPLKEESTQKKQSEKSTGNPSECKFHMGYLSERTQKEQIPEDCMLCQSIVECMLKRMRDET